MREVFNGFAHASVAAAVGVLFILGAHSGIFLAIVLGFTAGGIIGVLAELKEFSPQIDISGAWSTINWLDVLGYALGGALVGGLWI